MDKPRKKGLRNSVVKYALLGCKGGPMRDRRERRSKDARRSFKNEEWS